MDEDEILDINTEESETRYATSKADARGNLFDVKLESQNIQREDALAADQQNAAATENEYWGSKLGAWGSTGLAWMVGLSNPFALAAIAATGSFMGGKKGAENVGGYADTDDIRNTTFYGDNVEDTRKLVEDAQDTADSSRLLSAASDAFSVYQMAGGPIPGTSSWKTKELMNAAPELGKEAAIEQLTAKSLESGATQELASSYAESIVSKAFQSASVGGVIPKVTAIEELSRDVSSIEVLWENIINPNKKGSILGRSKVAGATLWDLHKTSQSNNGEA